MRPYEESKASWKKLVEEYPNSREPADLRHPTTCRDFVLELLQLAEATHDERFSAAIDALRENDVIDAKGAWRRSWKSDGDNLNRIFASAVDNRIRRGMTVTDACAEVADDLFVAGNGFEAACKKVWRGWKKYSGSPDNRPGGDV